MGRSRVYFLIVSIKGLRPLAHRDATSKNPGVRDHRAQRLAALAASPRGDAEARAVVRRAHPALFHALRGL